MTRRYAVYFAPAAAHPLWRAGCAWLGRDPESGAEAAAGAARAEPRRYGFHATLKPPFALRADAPESALFEALERLARDGAAFDMPALDVATLSGFVALRPVRPLEAAHPLRRLADDCVRRLDPLRRAPAAADLARRATPSLSPAERANLARWGYPYVFDEWRFHMTLSDAFAADAAGDARHAALLAAARAHFAPALAPPLRCDHVALFVEDAPGADFRLAHRFAFPS